MATDEVMLLGAKNAAEGAECVRRSVGAMIYNRQGFPIAHGANGGPADDDSCLNGACPRGRFTYDERPGYKQGNHDFGDCIAIHAEHRAILSLGPAERWGATVAITDEPCHGCKQIIKESGVARAVWPGGDMILGGN